MTEQARYVSLHYFAEALGLPVETMRSYNKRANRNRRRGRPLTTDLPVADAPPDAQTAGRPRWLRETADAYITLRLATKRGRHVAAEPRQRDEHGRFQPTAPDEPLRTSGGVELTNELVEQLADEAEAGYDPDKLVPRPTAQRGSSDGPVMVRLSAAERDQAAEALSSVIPTGLGLRHLITDGPRGWSAAMAPDRADEIAEALTEAWSKEGHRTFELAQRFAEDQEPARRTKRGGWAAGVRPGDRTE